MYGSIYRGLLRDPNSDASEGGGSGRNRELERKIAEMRSEREAREKRLIEREKIAEVQTALVGIQFLDADCRELVEERFSKLAEQSTSGVWMVGGEPLGAAVKSFLRRMPNLLSGWRGKTGDAKETGFDTDLIRPGMSKDDTNRAAKAIAAALKGGR